MKAFFMEVTSKRELEKGARFTLIALIVFSLAYALPYSVLPWTLFEAWTMHSSALALNLMGFDARTVSSEGFFIKTESTTAGIIELCTGYLEFVVLSAFILASEDRTLRRRVKGVLQGLAFILVLNPLRIAVTFSALATQGVAVADFIHNTLFKLSLFAVIFGFYAWWYLGLSRKK